MVSTLLKLPQRVVERMWPWLPRVCRQGILLATAQSPPRTLIREEIKIRIRRAGRPAFLFPPAMTWFSAGFQRPHQLARALSSLGFPTFFAEPWDTNNATMTADAIAQRRFVACREVESNLYLLRAPDWMLPSLIVDADIACLIMFWPEQGDLVPAEPPFQVVYEIIDDHSLVPDRSPEWQHKHLHWVAEADVVTATADDLLAQLRPLRPDTLLLPNAVHQEDWLRPQPPPLPADLAPARRAAHLAVYYGALADWFDWELWVAAARALPNWSFVLIGYPYDGNPQGVLDRIRDHPNMFYLGKKPYAQLPDYLAHCDVATIPFMLNAVTHACSPVKLFEYMAAGKPIVATPMREILKYRGIFFAENSEGFVRQLLQATQKAADTEYLSTLKQQTQHNTWCARARQLLESLRLEGVDDLK